MHITNQKLSFDIFMVVHLQNIFMEHNLHLTQLITIDRGSNVSVFYLIKKKTDYIKYNYNRVC